MSDEHPEDIPKTQPEFRRIPPWPPKKTARSFVDDKNPRPIAVVFTEFRERPDKTESSEEIADFNFDPGHDRSEQQTLTLQGVPPLLVTASYHAESGAVSVMVLQSGRELWTISSPGPMDAFSTFRLSSDVVMAVIIFRRSNG